MAEFPEEAMVAFLAPFRIAPEGLLGETLRQRTGLTDEELEGIRRRLGRDGFRFEVDAEGRWRMVEKTERLWPYWIKAGLRCDRLGCQIYYKEEMPSTQDIAFELMVEGRPHGTLVIAEHQTSGRGRGDRTWLSTPGRSLLFSLLLDLEPPDTFASVLTIAISTALARAIQDVAGVPARIKFPNDILVRGKKVAGILLEVRDYGVPRRAVAGVGINVNQRREDLAQEIRDLATSLLEERRDRKPVSRSRLLRYILRELEHWLDDITAGRYEEMERSWNRFSAMQGREVRFLKGTEEIRGRVLAARIREGLRVRLPDGKERDFRLEHLSDLSFL